MAYRSQDEVDEFIQQVCRAAEHGDLAKIRDLAEHGPGVNVRSSSGDTLLIEVIQAMMDGPEHRCDVVRLLLDLGADPGEDITDEDQWLMCMDRRALSLGKRRPDHLILLRKRGALTTREMAVKLGLPSKTPIEWADGWRADTTGIDPAPEDGS